MLLCWLTIPTLPSKKIIGLFDQEVGYQTPKVDVRGVIFQDGKLLMVREVIDGGWTVPGGWADVGYSPSEIAAKEVQEEAGITVKPLRLLAVLEQEMPSASTCSILHLQIIHPVRTPQRRTYHWHGNQRRRLLRP